MAGIFFVHQFDRTAGGFDIKHVRASLLIKSAHRFI